MRKRPRAVFGSSIPSDGNIDSSNARQDIEYRIRELQSQNESLASVRDDANQEKERMRKQAESFQSRYVEAELHIRQLQEQNTKYKDIFIKNARNDLEPLQSALTKSFCDLRDHIQTIVHKQYGLPPAKISKNPLFEKQRAFFKGPYFDSEIPRGTKVCFMRSKLFAFLQEEIFDVPSFGIGGDMEKYLVEFEVAVKARGKG